MVGPSQCEAAIRAAAGIVRDCRSAPAGATVRSPSTSALAADRHDDQEPRFACGRSLPRSRRGRARRRLRRAAAERRRPRRAARPRRRRRRAAAPHRAAAAGRGRRSPTPSRAPASGCCRTRRRSLGSGAARAGHRSADRRQHRPADQRHGADGRAARRPDHAPRADLERAAADARRAGQSRPLLLIGTLTAINTQGREGRERRRVPRSASRSPTCATGKLVAKRVDRATLATVDAEPTAALSRQPDLGARPRRRWPTSSRARAAAPGDALVPGYLRRLPAAAMINEAHARLRRQQAGRRLSPLPRSARRRRAATTCAS